MTALYRGAAGTVLASHNESQPLVLLESLACGTPVMGPNLLNLRSYWGHAIRYCSPPPSRSFDAQLSAFYQDCKGGLQQTFHVPRWSEIANRVLEIYEK